MTAAQLSAVARDLLVTAALLSLPAVLVSLLVGLAVSVFQAVTSLHEQTLSFAPRILAVAATLVLLLPWSLDVAAAFTVRMFHHVLEAAR
jgi:flagellar biosynthetic protein FliQ